MTETTADLVELRDPGADLAVAAPPPRDEAMLPLRLAVPLILAAGWGALLTFSVMFLMEDGRSAVAAPDRLAAAGPEAAPRRLEAAVGAIAAVATTPATGSATGPGRTARIANAVAGNPAEPAAALSAPAEAGPEPSAPSGERAGLANYVGVWGPTALACGAHSRRRGYLPARITEEGAQAGRTLCRFRNGRRDGPAWVMAADCSDRGRRWTSQVRLIVDGDRLTWTSAKGSANYVRCGHRDG